jgi:hypothetical protein
MKKILLIVLVLCSVNSYSQKKKKPYKVANSSVIAKTDDLTAELIKGNFYVFRNEKTAKKDTLLLKTITEAKLPTDCLIKKFTTKATPLYCITWVEKSSNDTSLKKELVTATNTQIWNPATKLQVFSNTQTSTNIKEQVFLDKNKTASETQERNRSEGFAFTLLPEGDFILKSKTAQSKYSFNPVTMKFEIPSKSSGQTPKKKK